MVLVGAEHVWGAQQGTLAASILIMKASKLWTPYAGRGLFLGKQFQGSVTSTIVAALCAAIHGDHFPAFPALLALPALLVLMVLLVLLVTL